MQRTINRTAHRGNGGRRGVENDASAIVFYPQYSRKSIVWQPLKRLTRRAMMGAALALTGAGERLGACLQWTGARLGLALAVAGDHLAAAALRWECEA